MKRRSFLKKKWEIIKREDVNRSGDYMTQDLIEKAVADAERGYAKRLKPKDFFALGDSVNKPNAVMRMAINRMFGE